MKKKGKPKQLFLDEASDLIEKITALKDSSNASMTETELSFKAAELKNYLAESWDSIFDSGIAFNQKDNLFRNCPGNSDLFSPEEQKDLLAAIQLLLQPGGSPFPGSPYTLCMWVIRNAAMGILRSCPGSQNHPLDVYNISHMNNISEILEDTSCVIIGRKKYQITSVKEVKEG